MAIKPVKVSQLNSYIKRILQTDPILGNVSVIGEVSNLKFHSSGHVYFTMKDDSSKVNCFLPSSLAYLAADLREGMEITIAGYIYLYERGGSYSLNVRDIEISGTGELAARFEKLKKKLEAAGWFAASHKKPIPAFPDKIAIVTSDTGAAVQDILKIITAKNNIVDIMIYPVLVQGPDAPGDIAAAIADINRNYSDVKTIIAGRGGGSMEELWAFNEEIVARAIFKSEIPVISAVGHETDFTIADFVADLRAETPSAAAEAAVPDTAELLQKISDCRNELKNNIAVITDRKKHSVELFNPNSAGRELQGRIALDQLRLDSLYNAAKESCSKKIDTYSARLDVLKEILDASNPREIMRKGYSIVTNDCGKIIRNPVHECSIDDTITIHAAEGSAEAKVTRLVPRPEED